MRRYLLLAVLLVVGLSVVGQAEYYDFGGATVNILAQSHHPAHRFLEGDWPGVNKFGTAYGLHEEAEALFNVNLQFHVFGWGEYPEALMTRLLSGDSEYDLWFMTNGRFWELMPQGAFYPLNDVLSEDYFDSLPGIPQGEAEFLSYAGVRYGFGSVGGGIQALQVLVYDSALFNTLGLPDPQELYFDGQWTWDALAEIAEQGTEDTTGDGEIDRWGIAGLGRPEYFAMFANTNAGAALVQEIDGQMRYTGAAPEFIEALNTVRDWMDRRFAKPGAALSVHFEVPTGESLMALGSLGRIGQLDPDARFAIVPLPMGPGSDEYRYPSTFIDTAMVLPANSRHPEGMVQLAQFLYPVEDYFDVVDETIRNIARDRVSAQVLWEMHDNWSGFVPLVPPPAAPSHQAVGSVLAGDSTAAVAMTEVASAVQSGLDELFDF